MWTMTVSEIENGWDGGGVEQLWKSTEGAGFFWFQQIEGRIHKPQPDFPTDISGNFVHVIDFVPFGKIQETDNLTQW